MIKTLLRLLCLLLWASLAIPTLAAAPGMEAEIKADPEVEARLVTIADELRCLVCQNESLSASRADLAKDLRREIRSQIQAGKSNQDILDFMVARYGDFVRYRPPFKASTALLWLGPALFLLLGGWWLRKVQRTRGAESNEAVSTDDGATPPPPPAPRPTLTLTQTASPSPATLWLLIIALPLLAMASYLWLGTPAALDPDKLLAADDPRALDRKIEQLAAKLAKQPDYLEGWLMLARSYRIQGDYVRAADAFARAGNKAHASASILAEYAEVLASRDGSFVGQASTLISEALGKDPEEPQALFLAGAAAAEQGDKVRARTLWQRVLPKVEAGSDAEATLLRALASLEHKKP